MSPPHKPGFAAGQRASLFMRIETTDTRSKDRVAATVIEIDAEGYIPREVGLAEDGTPIYVTRPGEYGRWNDSEIPRTPPGTPAFEEVWSLVGGSQIRAEEFEPIFAKADATLPHTIGGTPRWVSDLVSWAVILGLLALVVGVVYGLVRLFTG